MLPKNVVTTNVSCFVLHENPFQEYSLETLMVILQYYYVSNGFFFFKVNAVTNFIDNKVYVHITIDFISELGIILEIN